MCECDEYLDKLVKVRRFKDVLCEYPHESHNGKFYSPIIPFGFNIAMLPYFGNVLRTTKRYPFVVNGDTDENSIGFYADTNHYVWAMNLIEEVVAK